ncbi:hypothetical protein MLD38_018244 [Melastoma candidum]|uniref:Uncharacterized protein n=1 Tax=Melastoma candidum TaxID=119954 RepID=A0ACB9QUI5_9MYRT|nr:hypothetical protein MLD38_018244 [Melastoma candidum]
MESAEKVRLVRCPGCDNVLPELPDYSVYQCGGCGVVLRAKGKLPGDKCVSARDDDEESNKAVGEALERQFGNSAVPLGVSAAQGIEPGIDSLSLDQRQSDACVGETKPGIVENNVRSGKGVSVNVQNVNTSGTVTSLNGEDGGFKFRASCESELQNYRHVSGWQKNGAGNVVGSLRNGYSGSCAVRDSSSKYTDEGPSNYNFASVHNTREGRLGKHDVIDSGDGIRLLEKDRKELLRKLDKLKNQLSQSYGVGTLREGIPLNESTVHRDTFGNQNAHSPVNSVVLGKMLQQEQSDAGLHNAGLPYFGQFPNSLPHTKGQELMNNCDPAIHNPNHYPGFCDHYSTQMQRPCPGLYDRVPPHGLVSGQYLDASCDPFGPVPTNSIPRHPSCSCAHRINGYREASVPAPFSFCRGHPNISPNKSLHYFDNPGAFGPSYDGPRLAVPSFTSHLQRPQFQRPLGINPNRVMLRRPQRGVSFGRGRRGQPIAGGAPFLACGSCFELLQLPRGELLDVKKGGKFRCGACNTVISYDLINRKLMFSAQAEAKRATAEGDGSSSCEVIEGGYIRSHGIFKGASYGFSPDESGNSGYECLSSDRARATSTGCVNLSLTNSQEMESISPSLSDQENSPADLVDSEESALRKMITKNSPLPPGSPLQENLDHSFRDHSSNRFSKGNRSSRSDHEKVLSNKAVVKQNSLHEADLSTEVDIAFNEFSDNAVSGDSADSNREHDRPRGNKGESFLSNIFKKSFKDISLPGEGAERGKGKVFVNGHLIPDRLIKKAEKLAGPIHQGKYWYDFRAGFWGVMGGPCLGIIPPYIQEFNYPLTGSCSGGNTGVIVNGRELHQKDLDLLASRGLPLDRGWSYIIEISGRVYDEDTGQELDCLGKLAPTVEKVKHGFGMRGLRNKQRTPEGHDIPLPPP